MRIRVLAAVLSAAALLTYALASGSGSSPHPSIATSTDDEAVRADRLGLSGPQLAAAAGAPMPMHDERAAQFLAEHPLDDDVRGKLVALAQLQRVTYALRDPEHVETMAERADRRAQREAFRVRVRDVVASMPPSARAAMREHHVNLVRLAQTIETGGSVP